MIHTWTDSGVTYQLGGPNDLGIPAMLSVYQTPVLCREILRLAQREADLLDHATETLSILGVPQAPREQVVHVLASNARRLAQRERDLGAEITRLNERISADAQRIRDLTQALQGRDRSLEVVAAARDIAENARLAILHAHHIAKSARDKAEARVKELEAALEGERGAMHRERERIAAIVNRFVSNAWESAQVEGNIHNPGEVSYAFEPDPAVRDGRRTAFELERMLTEKEHQLALAKAAVAGLEGGVTAWKANHAHQRERIAALERESRQYCMELVDRAADIEEFKRERDAAVQLAADYQHQLVNLNASETAEMTRLRAAIEDGIAHVEKARQGLSIMGTVAPITGLSGPLEQLDLAHEALSAAVRVDRGGAAPGGEAVHAVPAGLPWSPAEAEAFLVLLAKLGGSRGKE